MYTDGKIWLGQSADKNIYLLPQMANRHGLISGATGTGKTITMKVLAEGFAQAGVPVFMADVKGDVTGMAQPGDDTEKVRERAAALGADGWEPRGCDVRLWDMLGGDGIVIKKGKKVFHRAVLV